MISYLLFAAFLAGALQGLQPGTGVVTGVIRIQGGAVAAGVRVGAVPVDDVAGASMVSVVETDASGRYRLTNIPEGRYYIVAGRIATPTYYPGGSDRAAAKEINVEAARVHASVDFAVPPGNNRPPPPPPPIAYQAGEMEAYKAATVEPGADNRLRLLLQFEQRYPKSVYLPEVFAATMEIYAAKRLPAEASVYGNKALKLNPRDAVVLLQFSRLHALVNGDFGTALDFAEKALAAASAMKSQPPRRPLFTVQTWPGWVATLEKNAQTNLVWVKERVNWQRQMILSNMTRRR